MPDKENITQRESAVTEEIAESPMASAARSFLASLTETQKASLVFDFDDEERKNFNFVPMNRKGLIFKNLDQKQRALCLKFIKNGLSEKGYLQTVGIMANEAILSNLEGRPEGNDYRHPERYFIAIFGEPGTKKPWGWRFEGHHLSLNYTSVDDNLSVTPLFMGANPAQVPSGKYAGSRLLPEEEDIGRRLALSLDEAQRRYAIISKTAFPEIITGNQRVASLDKKEGIGYEALMEDQKELLEMLIKTYLNRVESDVAAAKWYVIQKELSDVYFSWAGGLVPGEGHYYRVHGKSFLIEYDNTQNNANHIHTVWREFNGDFGRDLLQEHYRHSHKH